MFSHFVVCKQICGSSFDSNPVWNRVLLNVSSVLKNKVTLLNRWPNNYRKYTAFASKIFSIGNTFFMCL